MTTYNFNILVKDQNANLIDGADITIYSASGSSVSTGTTNSFGTLDSNITLDDTNNVHLVKVTKTGYTPFFYYYNAYQDDTGFYVRLPSYSTTYCTVQQVAEFLGLDPTTFSPSSTPTDSVIADYIKRNEGEIDRFTMTSFKSNLVTSEYHDLNPNARTSDGYMPIFPTYRPLLIKDSDWKIENFDGNSYIDFVTDKTEGRGDDYWIDYNKSIIYIKPVEWGDHYLRLTYKWGKSTVPSEIEKLCILKTALNLVDNDDYAANIKVGDQDLSTKRDSYISQIKSLQSIIKTMRF